LGWSKRYPPILHSLSSNLFPPLRVLHVSVVIHELLELGPIKNALPVLGVKGAEWGRIFSFVCLPRPHLKTVSPPPPMQGMPIGRLRGRWQRRLKMQSQIARCGSRAPQAGRRNGRGTTRRFEKGWSVGVGLRRPAVDLMRFYLAGRRALYTAHRSGHASAALAAMPMDSMKRVRSSGWS